jgi:hypothetical protein
VYSSAVNLVPTLTQAMHADAAEFAAMGSYVESGARQNGDL